MKVLKNNYNAGKIAAHETIVIPRYPRKYICDSCESELEYDKSDLRMGEYGCMHLTCPLCKWDNMLEDHEDNITLTMYNIDFPTHYHHISKESGAIDICNNGNIREEIKNAIKYFREHKDEFEWGGWRSGNLYVDVHRYEDDEMYEVTVSNDFYNMDIPFEPEDYK